MCQRALDSKKKRFDAAHGASKADARDALLSQCATGLSILLEQASKKGAINYSRDAVVSSSTPNTPTVGASSLSKVARGPKTAGGGGGFGTKTRSVVSGTKRAR